ncbi:unannotated protein [freshwater metagenome]|uniref:Unannotated protein n=1 Tax=freshwater metagenome TaxID=449393 RepID=A0A6J7SXS7_9ZZZZ
MLFQSTSDACEYLRAYLAMSASFSSRQPRGTAVFTMIICGWFLITSNTFATSASVRRLLLPKSKTIGELAIAA